MPDITMCIPVKECPLKDTCYRFKASPNSLWQSYSAFEYAADKGCDNYIKIIKTTEIKGEK